MYGNLTVREIFQRVAVDSPARRDFDLNKLTLKQALGFGGYMHVDHLSQSLPFPHFSSPSIIQGYLSKTREGVECFTYLTTDFTVHERVTRLPPNLLQELKECFPMWELSSPEELEKKGIPKDIPHWQGLLDDNPHRDALICDLLATWGVKLDLNTLPFDLLYNIVIHLSPSSFENLTTSISTSKILNGRVTVVTANGRKEPAIWISCLTRDYKWFGGEISGLPLDIQADLHEAFPMWKWKSRRDEEEYIMH